MDPRLETNRTHWDELVPIHVGSRFYDLDGFLAGDCQLLPIEVSEIGRSVWGKSMVHLQCHIGTDTLSWARRGARVTGVDFSVPALDAARALARRADIDEVRFVESEVTRAPEALGGEQFDVVFTSWGVLGWLPDVEAWARAAAALVRPGGVFYMVELHPTILLFDGSSEGQALTRNYPYFRTAEALELEESGTYADPDAEVFHRQTFQFIFELGQVVSALVAAGLRIEYLHEHDATCCAIVPSLELGEDRLYRQPAGALDLPLSFSIRATKP